jgi:hypothetical protein
MNDGFDFDKARSEWVAKGRPADPADPYWADLLARLAEPRKPAEPLAILVG